jgi:hypothetical protein
MKYFSRSDNFIGHDPVHAAAMVSPMPFAMSLARIPTFRVST